MRLTSSWRTSERVINMNDQDNDRSELLEANERAENYYRKLKEEMMSAVQSFEENNEFSGVLDENSITHLLEIAQQNHISSFSQVLAELLTLIEWHNDKRSPIVQETAIYNALLRVEKDLQHTSCWELLASELEGPLITISNFEVITLEQAMSTYVLDVLGEGTLQKMFFPLSDVFESEIIVKWKILEKIGSIKLSPHQTIYHQKLEASVRRRIKDEVIQWLDDSVKNMKLKGKTTALDDTAELEKLLKELQSKIEVCNAVVCANSSFFEHSTCSYFDCLADALDDKLYPICKQITEEMDRYQDFHRAYHVNLRDSCALSHSLYSRIRSLMRCLKPLRKTTLKMNLENYNSLFENSFLTLLQVLKLESHNRIRRAVEDESKDTVHVEERIMSSAVIALNCFCTVLDELKRMEIEDDNLLTAFTVKIADIICDGAKIFAESLDSRLNAIGEDIQDINIGKKACILANSVLYIQHFIRDLPSKVQAIHSQTEDVECAKDVSRILNLIHESMENELQNITQKLLNVAVSQLLKMSEKQMTCWLSSNNSIQIYEKWVVSFGENLEHLLHNLKENLKPQFLTELKLRVLMRIESGFLEGQPPEYAINLKENIENLEEYFLYLRTKVSEDHQEIYQKIMTSLHINSKSTVDLQLDYFSNIAESLTSPLEYLGHIAFQAGYKTFGKNTVNLHVKVQKCQRLPSRKFEMSNLIIKLELYPKSMFPSQVPLKSKVTFDDPENFILNEDFIFQSLPLNALGVKGAVLQVLVLNQDRTYSAESVLLLKQVQNMSGFVSMEFLPVYLLPLKKFDISTMSFQVLENRTKWDKSAKNFISSRVKLNKQQKKFLSCLPKTNMCIF